MCDDMYRLEGTVKISENRKDEFNKYVLQILDVCGIRKTEEMELGGQRITVVRQPQPDEQGIVCFDYSIFEKKKRETATYNMNTCELKVPDRGYNEFGVVMNMIMVMQESYSEEQCYFMYKDEPCKIGPYALLIKSLLEICLEFPNRARMWDMLLFLKNRERDKSITSKMIWDAYTFDFYDFIPEQFLAAFCIDSDKIEVPKEPFEGGKAEIKTAPKGKLSYYVYQKMKIPDGFLKKFFMLIVEIDQYYKRIYSFQSMFYEFLQNGHKTEYRAAIELLKKISDENKEEGKIIEKVKGSWDLTSRNVTHNAGRLKVKRYLSVMANRGLRERYFGF